MKAQLRLQRNAMGIYQNLVDRIDFAASYDSVKRFVRTLRYHEPAQFDRLNFLPGEEAQVDYGEGALVRVQGTNRAGPNRYRKPRLFVMTLRYSRRSFGRVVWKSGKQVWAGLREQARHHFGGVTQYVALDNLKEGAVKPDLYEPDRRQSRLLERRYQQSGLDEHKTLAGFDWAFNPKVPRQACFELHTLKFVADSDNNALLIGKPGIGKSHVAKAVAYNATLQGMKVRYVESDTVFAGYAVETHADQDRFLKALVEPKLLVLDDLFLAKRVPDAAAELLQTLAHQRYRQRRSIPVKSNRVVQDWWRYLRDSTMTSTVLDRLLHRSRLLAFEGKSYRLREAATRLAATEESDA